MFGLNKRKDVQDREVLTNFYQIFVQLCHLFFQNLAK
jgi:hypothetical protein